jgi:hypothetical protein
VDDPRDAALAVAWARRMQKAPWPWWLLPRTRPHGWRAALWILHSAWIVTAIATAVILPTWRDGGVLRWVIVGAVAYSVVTYPWILTMMLQTRWSAPAAERRNRELLHDRPG